MRYLIAIISGALVAALPPLILAFPHFAWQQACGSIAETLPGVQTFGALWENPCGLIDETLAPLSVRLLWLSVLAIGCALGGAMAARIAERRRFVVAFLAPSLPYALFFFLALGVDIDVMAVAVPAALAAGALGTLGAGWKELASVVRGLGAKHA